jgi:hypothetical protein
MNPQFVMYTSVQTTAPPPPAYTGIWHSESLLWWENRPITKYSKVPDVPVWNWHRIQLHIHHHVQKHIQKMATANFNHSKQQNYKSAIFSHNKHLNATKTR